MPKSPPAPDIAVLLPSWVLSLRADRKSPQTIKSYSDAARLYISWCEAEGATPLDRTSLRRWTTSLLDGGAAPATVRARQLGMRRYAAWLLDEGEITEDPFVGIKPPRLDSTVTEPLTEEELRALLKACEPGRDADPNDLFRGRRDEAILRLMLETGARAGEIVAIELADLDLAGGNVIIRRGKGGKGRSVPFGPHTAKAIDRYARVRNRHRLASSPALWLGDRGKGFTYDALHKTLGARASAAGIARFHPHIMRHTAAHRWLAAGGSEGGLMAVAGWTRPDMLMRYTRARASARAAEEAARLNLGDL
ncbi:MAG: tyrosine-type recombinase/integrase [Actinobacteria bacterium]|uniref:Tyrosine-type recombinase/integrase n=1 Tax=Nostocoides veronense TaxID=330836 RepID=A0ABN2LE60_9MICO|nr:tyrosine-type recombinase/integrase [Actinomycetota bacterium]